MTGPDPAANASQASNLVVLAESFAEQGDWQSADRLFLEALTLESSDSNRISYGVCLSKQERYFEAISNFTPVLDGGDRSAISVVCHNLAAIYREVGDLDLARRFQWRATLLQDDSGTEEVLGMANDALASEHHETAASLVMTACDLNAETSEDISDGDLVATTGLVNAALYSKEEGLITLFAAYRRHQAVRDLRGMGLDQMNMAVLFADLGRYRAERSCLMRAIRYFERASAPLSCQRARQQLDRLDRMQIVRSFDARRN